MISLVPLPTVRSPAKGASVVNDGQTVETPAFGLLRRQNPTLQLTRQQLEIREISSYHRGPMTTGGERNQGVVLEVPSFMSVPSLSISDFADEFARLPPIGSCRFPAYPSESVEREHALFSLTSPGSTAKF